MKFKPHQYYYVYNQGNNNQQLFFDKRNYRYFLSLVQKFVVPNCELLAWCLMPTHFHFLIYTTDISVRPRQIGSLQLTELSNSIRMLQSSYASAINKERGESGSKFRQKAKADKIESKNSLQCFYHIHQNPLKGQLVNRIEDWPFSSFHEFKNTAGSPLCNVTLAASLLDINSARFYQDPYQLEPITDNG